MHAEQDARLKMKTLKQEETFACCCGKHGQEAYFSSMTQLVEWQLACQNSVAICVHFYLSVSIILQVLTTSCLNFFVILEPFSPNHQHL